MKRGREREREGERQSNPDCVRRVHWRNERAASTALFQINLRQREKITRERERGEGERREKGRGVTFVMYRS